MGSWHKQGDHLRGHYSVQVNDVVGLDHLAALEVVRSSQESRSTKVATELEIGYRRKESGTMLSFLI